MRFSDALVHNIWSQDQCIMSCAVVGTPLYTIFGHIVMCSCPLYTDCTYLYMTSSSGMFLMARKLRYSFTSSNNSCRKKKTLATTLDTNYISTHTDSGHPVTRSHLPYGLCLDLTMC